MWRRGTKFMGLAGLWWSLSCTLHDLLVRYPPYKRPLYPTVQLEDMWQLVVGWEPFLIFAFLPLEDCAYVVHVSFPMFHSSFRL